VSCESWGYLPYTTGYWNYYDGFGWGWMPGYGYPWWFTGGWGWNIGVRPPRYYPPHRPKPGPIHPVGPIRHGGLYQPNPVVAVNRIPSVPVASPAHVVGRPVTIAGSTVEPMRPLSPRPVYNHETMTGSGRAFLGSNMGGRTGYNPWANSPEGSRPGTWTMPAAGTGYHGTAISPYAGAGGTYRPPIASPYSGSVGRSPAAAPAPHVSSGGGGGGHVSVPSGGGGGHVSAPSSGGGHH
jgi:hypothetical protein